MDELVNILIVDDRPDKALALESILTNLGQRVVKAGSGKDALRRLMTQDFALILLDVNMPIMDGFETASLIRQREKSEHTPIIFVTATDSADTHASRGYSLGAVDYILTPIIPEVLRAKVSVFIELHKKTEQIRKQAEEQILLEREHSARLAAEQRSTELEKRVLERTLELQSANSELEAFSYSVSHDLRAPLRTLSGFSTILLEDYESKLDDTARDYLRRIRNASDKMGSLIDALLNLSRVSREQMRRMPVDLHAMSQRIVGELRSTQPRTGIEVHIAENLSANVDERLIGIVLENLLNNAWKYTSRHGAARIEVGSNKSPDGCTVFFVKDDGAGFDMAYAGKLFGAFQRLHGVNEFAGTGIGLATVQRIVHRHGGRIWAEAAVEKGVTFYFTLEPAGTSQ